MQKYGLMAASSVLALLLTAACSPSEEVDTTPPADTTDAAGTAEVAEREMTEEAESAAGILELSAAGLAFEGPGSIASGWTEVRFDNSSGMIHFAMLERLPDGVTIDDQIREVSPPFQNGMDALIAGNTDAAMAAFGELPAWFGDIVFIGGPGLISGGDIGTATVYLEPGRYSIECYVKSGGVFHTYNPATQERAMLHELIVEDAEGGGAEPDSNVTLDITNEGITIADGSFATGLNTVRVNYVEQMAHGNFVGHDVHMARIGEDTGMDTLADWMDWRNPEGLQTPAPAIFVGGLNEMPAGTHGYFNVDLEPGNYVLISEIDDPNEKGFLVDVTVTAD